MEAPHRVMASDGPRAQKMDSATATGAEGADVLDVPPAIAATGEVLGRSQRTPWRLWLVSAATAIAAHGVILVLPMAEPEETISLPPPAPKAAVLPLTAIPTPTPKPQPSPRQRPATTRSTPAARPTANPPRDRRPVSPAPSPSPKPAPSKDSQKPDPSPSPSPSPTPTPTPTPTPEATDPPEQDLDLTQNPPPSPEPEPSPEPSPEPEPEPSPEPEPEPEPEPLGLPSLPGLPVSEGGCGAGASCYGLPENFGVHSITAQRLQAALGDQVIVREISDLYDRTEQAREFVLTDADSTEEIGYYYVISTPIAGQVGAVMLGSRDRLSSLEEIRQMALGQTQNDGDQ